MTQAWGPPDAQSSELSWLGRQEAVCTCSITGAAVAHRSVGAVVGGDRAGAVVAGQAGHKGEVDGGAAQLGVAQNGQGGHGVVVGARVVVAAGMHSMLQACRRLEYPFGQLRLAIHRAATHNKLLLWLQTCREGSSAKALMLPLSSRDTQHSHTRC